MFLDCASYIGVALYIIIWLENHICTFSTNVCSNGGATCIINEKLAEDSLNIANVMQTLQIFFWENTQPIFRY